MKACTEELNIDFGMEIWKGCTPHPWVTRGGYFWNDYISSMTAVGKALLAVAVPI
jgi:hypothetical protein